MFQFLCPGIENGSENVITGFDRGDDAQRELVLRWVTRVDRSIYVFSVWNMS